MRPRYKPPMNKKYYHSKRIVDKSDLNFLKKKIEKINKIRIKKEFDEKDKRKFWKR
jgi:hypothetical protein